MSEHLVVTTAGQTMRIAASSYGEAVSIAERDGHRIDKMPPINAKSLALLFGSGKYPHMSNVKPVQLTIYYKGKPECFFGISYTETLTHTEGTRIVQDGTVKAGDTYTRDGYYLLGNLPKSYKDKQKVGGFWEQKNHYKLAGNHLHWYVACYYEGGQTSEHHPLGNMFVLLGSEPETFEGKNILKMEVTDTL